MEGPVRRGTGQDSRADSPVGTSQPYPLGSLIQWQAQPERKDCLFVSAALAGGLRLGLGGQWLLDANPRRHLLEYVHMGASAPGILRDVDVALLCHQLLVGSPLGEDAVLVLSRRLGTCIQVHYQGPPFQDGAVGLPLQQWWVRNFSPSTQNRDLLTICLQEGHFMAAPHLE